LFEGFEIGRLAERAGRQARQHDECLHGFLLSAAAAAAAPLGTISRSDGWFRRTLPRSRKAGAAGAPASAARDHYLASREPVRIGGASPMTEQNFGFQAEVAKLLDIVANALYSEREVFLRELISNASDACDKLRYAALAQPELLAEDGAFRITLAADAKARTLTVADNGIGMNRQELIDNLGTIARSGTAAFVAGLSGDKAKDSSLIGQFGVGFSATFMVADRVE